MEQMIAQGHPILAFLDGTVLARPYGGHWVVVTGFSFDGQDDDVHLNDPDSNASGGNPGHPIVLKLSDFQKAGRSGTIKQWQPYGLILGKASGIITPSTALNQMTQAVTGLLGGQQPPSAGSSESTIKGVR